MTIRLETEQLVSLSEAAKLLPMRRNGKRLHITTLYRWTTHGCRGVVLESIQVGAMRCTSKEALDRFFRTLSSLEEVGSPARERTVAERNRAIRRAEERLGELGA